MIHIILMRNISSIMHRISLFTFIVYLVVFLSEVKFVINIFLKVINISRQSISSGVRRGGRGKSCDDENRLYN